MEGREREKAAMQGRDPQVPYVDFPSCTGRSSGRLWPRAQRRKVTLETVPIFRATPSVSSLSYLRTKVNQGFGARPLEQRLDTSHLAGEAQVCVTC
jgi:hypothetical protein